MVKWYEEAVTDVFVNKIVKKLIYCVVWNTPLRSIL